MSPGLQVVAFFATVAGSFGLFVVCVLIVQALIRRHELLQLRHRHRVALAELELDTQLQQAKLRSLAIAEELRRLEGAP